MIYEVFMKILPYAINLFSGVLLLVITYKFNKSKAEKEKEVKNIEEQKKIDEARLTAISNGLCASLRNTIVADYNKYTDKGYCPIYAKESLKILYSSYTALGGNDVASTLYHKLLEMPEELNNTPDGV